METNTEDPQGTGNMQGREDTILSNCINKKYIAAEKQLATEWWLCTMGGSNMSVGGLQFVAHFHESKMHSKDKLSNIHLVEWAASNG